MNLRLRRSGGAYGLDEEEEEEENQLRESIHKWLCPPDPSTNHNTALGTHHKGTTAWFLEGNTFQEWKTTGSLLWIHSKRAPCLTFFPGTISCRIIIVAGSGKTVLWFVDPLIILSGLPTSPVSSTIIKDITAMCEAGHASMAYFYFDLLDVNKQHLHDPIPSFLYQLSTHSHPRCDILSGLYKAHDSGG